MNFVLLQEVAAGKFPCGDCSKVSKSAGRLKLHQRRKHETSEQHDDPDADDEKDGDETLLTTKISDEKFYKLIRDVCTSMLQETVHCDKIRKEIERLHQNVEGIMMPELKVFIDNLIGRKYCNVKSKFYYEFYKNIVRQPTIYWSINYSVGTVLARKFRETLLAYVKKHYKKYILLTCLNFIVGGMSIAYMNCTSFYLTLEILVKNSCSCYYIYPLLSPLRV